MATENETISEIIAEKRRRAEEIERDCAEKMKRGEMTSDQFTRELVADIRREADRLEAAYNREGDASGNTAALHEVLKPVKRYLDGYTVNILELRRTVDAALTAPARNCDLFNHAEPDENAKQALDAHGGLLTCSLPNLTSREYAVFKECMAIIGWLFSPAKISEAAK